MKGKLIDVPLTTLPAHSLVDSLPHGKCTGHVSIVERKGGRE